MERSENEQDSSMIKHRITIELEFLSNNMKKRSYKL